MTTVLRDRREGGRLLAAKLRRFAGRPDVVVLGLPRGGIPVAHEIAIALGAPLDALVVRKLGVPGYEELAMGAIAAGGVRSLDRATIAHLGVRREAVEAVIAREERELERRERLYRGGRPAPAVHGRTVILVDDGLATGASMRAAIAALRAQGPAAIVVAAPVGSTSTCEEMRRLADDCVCVVTPEPFYGVGAWYADFSQTTDAEVRELLGDAPRHTAPALSSA
jgi:predicted phosphoribosyltransferase